MSASMKGKKMIQSNKELAGVKVRLAILKGGILLSPFILLAVAVWVYTQRWAGITANMDLAVIGVNTASLLLTIYVGYFIIVRVSDGPVDDLKKDGLLVSGGQHVGVEPENKMLNAVNEGLLEGVELITDFDPVKESREAMIHYRANKVEAKKIKIAKAQAEKEAMIQIIAERIVKKMKADETPPVDLNKESTTA
ncbi:hypothetical protein [Glutamicibacter ardleyensis]|uniref:hypothetical protein n=1 Tax=Glutamicibacter ardleyensis TaxID=225894 RepID=UPI003FCF3116